MKRSILFSTAEKRITPRLIIIFSLLIIFVIPLLACGQTQPVTPPDKPTMTVEMTLEELVASADWIVKGYVLSKDTRKDAASGKINTFFTVYVNEWLKGNTGNTHVIVRVQGGVIGNETQMVEDAQSLSTGETVLLYLTANSDGTGSMIGGPQGKITISGGTSTGLTMPAGESTEILINRIKSIVANKVGK